MAWSEKIDDMSISMVRSEPNQLNSIVMNAIRTTFAFLVHTEWPASKDYPPSARCADITDITFAVFT